MQGSYDVILVNILVIISKYWRCLVIIYTTYICNVVEMKLTLSEDWGSLMQRTYDEKLGNNLVIVSKYYRY